MLSKADLHHNGSIDLPELYTEEAEDEVLDFIAAEKAKLLSTDKNGALPDRSIVEWIAGFLDGDGCVHLFKGRTNAMVTVSQAHTGEEPPATLQRIYRHYGGSFCKRPRKNGTRQQWILQISQSTHNHTLLREIADHGIIKAPQAALLLNFFEEGMVNRGHAYRQLGLLKKRYHEIVVDASRLTASYIGGLFDAEGSVEIRIKGALSLEIAQKSSPPPLRAILSRWPGGIVNDVKIRYNGEAVDDIFADLLQHSLGKADQLQIVAQHRRDQKDWRSEHGNGRRTGTVLQAWTAEIARRRGQLTAMKRK